MPAIVLGLRPIAALACLGVLPACSSDPVVLVLDITPGHEQGAFSEDPYVSRIDVVGATPEGDILLGATSAPGGSFDLGEVPEDRLLQFEVTGMDAAGTTHVRGRSLGIVLGAIEGDVLPIFAQRLERWARPPGGLAHTHVAGVAGMLGERFLLLTGGTTVEAETDQPPSAPAYYDLLNLAGSSGAELPRTARSLVMGADGVSALLIDDHGASVVDYDGGSASDVSPPEGLNSFAEVAGGATVTTPDGTSYVVGATRPDEPSDAIVVWTPGETSLSLARLAHPRRGAAAAWLDSVGLVVAGGEASAPGLEVLAPGASQTATRPYPADPTEGACALVRGSGQFVLVGGHEQAGAAPARLIDPSCSASSCESQLLDLTIPVPLDGCQSFAVDADHAIVLGADLDAPIDLGSLSLGQTRTFLVDLIAETALELELREPRAGATALATSHGLLAVLGGVHLDGTSATTIEMLVPEGL